MPIKPHPFTLTCTECDWQHTVVPLSDAISLAQWPEHCGGCRGKTLQVRPATWLETLMARHNPWRR